MFEDVRKNLMQKVMKKAGTETDVWICFGKNGYRWNAELSRRRHTVTKNTVTISGCKGESKSVRTEYEEWTLPVNQEIIGKAALITVCVQREDFGVLHFQEGENTMLFRNHACRQSSYAGKWRNMKSPACTV
jgi:hypothetical protein